MAETYDEHAIQQSQRAEEAMGIFLGTLPDRERRKLLDLAPSESSGEVGLNADMAEDPRASYSVDLAAECDDLADELMEQFRFIAQREDAVRLSSFIEDRIKRENERYNAWLLTKVIMRLTEAGNSKIVAVSLAFAAGVPEVWVNGQLCHSQIQAARVLCVSRQNLSKEVRTSADWLGIEEGIHLKKPGAIEGFRLAQTKNHWRKRLYGQ